MSGSETNKKLSMRMVLAGIGLVLVVFVAFMSLSVIAWEYSNSDSFCANACHAVHPEEPYAHQLGRHAQVACVECHVGRLSTFSAMAKKSGHVAHAWSFAFGYERPTSAPSFSGSLDSCEGCHTREPHRHNVVKSEKRYSDDRRNTETKLTLTMRLSGRNFGEENRRGVNWHASGAVRFISDGPQNLAIRWVEVTLPDGAKRYYHDARNPLTQDVIDSSDKQVMDCGDCHNRAGHPFRNPEENVDAALADGRLSTNLPFIKRRMIELLEQDFESEEEARELISEAWQQYREDFPEIEQRDPEAWKSAQDFLEERRDFLLNLMARSRFVSDGISWRSFPDHNGHKLDPGCFRCHSGRLQTSEGTPITANCTTCHSIPLVTRRDRVPDYFLSLIDKEKPESHHEADFISRHMDLVGEECTTCHEETRFGVNDRTYCSNSGCHGEVWEYLDLDALRTRETQSGAPGQQQ